MYLLKILFSVGRKNRVRLRFYLLKKNLIVFLPFLFFRLVGSFIFSYNTTSSDIKEFIKNEIFKYPAFQGNLLLYEECTASELSPITRNVSLQKLEIISGDIIVFEM